MPQNEEYTKKYQNQYYKKVTKVKRKLNSIQKKADYEKQKVTLSTTPREITYTCPNCNMQFTELSSCIKPKKNKLCPECKRKILNERAKLPENRQKANERKRFRYHNEEGYKEKVAEATKKWKTKGTQKLIQEVQTEKVTESNQAKVKKRRGRKPNVLTTEFTPKRAILVKKSKSEN